MHPIPPPIIPYTGETPRSGVLYYLGGEIYEILPEKRQTLHYLTAYELYTPLRLRRLNMSKCCGRVKMIVIFRKSLTADTTMPPAFPTYTSNLVNRL
jgi:hypothetical protein